MATTDTSSTLRLLHTEIRWRIFEMCLMVFLFTAARHEHTSYTTPTLLVALRGDPVLYQEALQIFFRINTVYFTTRNFGGFEDRSPVLSARHLGIHLVPHFNCNQFSKFLAFLFQRRTPNPLFRIREHLEFAAHNLQTLHINVSPLPAHVKIPLMVMQGILPYCEKLQTLCVSVRVENVHDCGFNQRHHVLYSTIQNLMDACTLVRRTVIPATLARGNDAIECSVWTAAKGLTIKPSGQFSSIEVGDFEEEDDDEDHYSATSSDMEWIRNEYGSEYDSGHDEHDDEDDEESAED